MRPASFPGPAQQEDSTEGATGGARGGHGGSQVKRFGLFKPPRQHSQPTVVTDEDLTTMEAGTYRHLMQDLTSFKTMLFKLKRVIQEVHTDSFSICVLSGLVYYEKIALVLIEFSDVSPSIHKDSF